MSKIILIIVLSLSLYADKIKEANPIYEPCDELRLQYNKYLVKSKTDDVLSERYLDLSNRFYMMYKECINAIDNKTKFEAYKPRPIEQAISKSNNIAF
jgi:hypothetical protein